MLLIHRGRSTYRGVTKHHSQRNQAGYSKRAVKGRWEARIGRVDGGKYKYLGTFLTERDAAVAYDKAVMAYRGAKVSSNFRLLSPAPCTSLLHVASGLQLAVQQPSQLCLLSCRAAASLPGRTIVQHAVLH